MKKLISAALTLLLIFNANAPLFAAHHAEKDIQNFILQAKKQADYDIKKLKLEAEQKRADLQKILLDLEEEIALLEKYDADSVRVASLKQDKKEMQGAISTYKKNIKQLIDSSLGEGFHIPSYVIAFGFAEAAAKIIAGSGVASALKVFAGYASVAAVIIAAVIFLPSCTGEGAHPENYVWKMTPLRIKNLAMQDPNFYLKVPSGQIKYLAAAEAQYPELKTARANYLAFLKAVGDDSFKAGMKMQLAAFSALPKEQQTQSTLVQNVAKAYGAVNIDARRLALSEEEIKKTLPQI